MADKKLHELARSGRGRDGTPWVECRCGQRIEAAHQEDVDRLLSDHLEGR